MLFFEKRDFFQPRVPVSDLKVLQHEGDYAKMMILQKSQYWTDGAENWNARTLRVFLRTVNVTFDNNVYINIIILYIIICISK